MLELGVGGGGFDSVEGEGKSPGANEHGFAGVGKWEVLNAIDHGNGKLEPVVKGGGGEKVSHIYVSSEISEVVGDGDLAVANGPYVVFELFASVWCGRENHTFVCGDLGAEVVQVRVSEGDLFDEVLNVVGAGGGVQEVVSE